MKPMNSIIDVTGAQMRNDDAPNGMGGAGDEDSRPQPQ